MPATTTVSKSFTAVGVSDTLSVPRLGETVTLAGSGTYAATFQLERAVTPDESAWEKVLGPYSTANATVAATYTTDRPNEKFRIRCTAYTSGTLVTSIVDEDATIFTFRDPVTNDALYTVKESGIVYPNPITLNQNPINASGVGAIPAVTGLAVAEYGQGKVHQTVFTFTDMTLAVTDALAYASQKIYDFPAGRVLILGATAQLKWGVTTTRASTINDSAAMDWSVGTAAASATTLATTMLDLIAKVDHTLDGSGSAYTAFIGGTLAASAQFDGTTTAVDAYLNVAFPTTTDIDADGTLKVAGTITISWVDLGDY